MASSGSVHSVFVYGSLMADDVVRVLLNRVPLASSAILHDFHRFSIKGRVYPAILPVEKKNVTGRVLMGITDPELYILDTFEDEEYERMTVEVSLIVAFPKRYTTPNLETLETDTKLIAFYTDTFEKLDAHAYVWSNKDDPNLYGEWDFEEWRLKHMEGFLAMTKEFKEELDLPESKSRVATYENFYQKGS